MHQAQTSTKDKISRGGTPTPNHRFLSAVSKFLFRPELQPELLWVMQIYLCKDRPDILPAEAADYAQLPVERMSQAIEWCVAAGITPRVDRNRYRIDFDAIDRAAAEAQLIAILEAEAAARRVAERAAAAALVVAAAQRAECRI